MRATGEGHISSLCFRGGVIDAEGQITVDKPTGFVTLPQVVPNAEYDKALFHRKLGEMGIDGGFVESALGKLEDLFTLDQLERAVQDTLRQHRPRHREWESVAKAIVVLAKANYEIQCDPEGDISERTIFPYSPTEQNGIEDARFVLFTDDDENSTLLRDLHGLRRQRRLAANGRNGRLPAVSNQYAQRAGNPQQGNGLFPAENRRPLRHAVAAGRRELVPDVSRTC